jgi:hypothetical protein
MLSSVSGYLGSSCHFCFDTFCCYKHPCVVFRPGKVFLENTSLSDHGGVYQSRWARLCCNNKHPNVRSHSCGQGAGVKDFTKARVKTEAKFYLLSRGGTGQMP